MNPTSSHPVVPTTEGTSPRPGWPQTAGGTSAPDLVPSASRGLPNDRWLPPLSLDLDPFLHWVPAGTRPVLGGREHYRAVCGAECLRMPVGQPSRPYAYESRPHHEDCEYP